MKYQYVEYDKKDHVVTIALNRQDRRNSTSWELVRNFLNAFKEYEDDSDARVCIITGKGAAFCVGRDHRDTAEMTKMSEEQVKQINYERNKWTAFLLKELSGKPIITAINGFAIGGGFALALLGLLRIAAETTVFQFSEINVSLMRGNDLFPMQGIPLCIAAELALGKRITAQRAYEVGLINKVVPDAELMPAAMEMAEYVAGLPPLALKYTIDGLQRSRITDLTLRELQAVRTEELKRSEDAQEAARAFVEKRKPIFKGK
jgi:enoyl-CoA hydratase/carnithine racemase